MQPGVVAAEATVKALADAGVKAANDINIVKVRPGWIL